MNLLVIDTATEACSVALRTGNNVITERFEICPQQHSQRLLPMVDEVLNAADVEIAALDGLAFGRGPGSFTGVRIATGMIQGLALGTGLPVAGVSTLTAMAVEVHATTGARRVMTAIDARMNEVYFAAFEFDSGTAHTIIPEQVIPPEDAASLVTGDYAVAGTGWQAYPALSAICDGEPVVRYPNARFMISEADRLFVLGQASSAANIEPVYLRDKVTWKKLPGRE